MAISTLRKAVGAVKDQASIGLAKVSSNNDTMSRLHVAVVKATRHNEYPASEKHVRDILTLTCYSRHMVATCVEIIARRLGKTRSWCVALKILVLVHRLLLDGDPVFEHELFFTTRRGARLLELAEFRDVSAGADSWDYSAFIRTFGRFLDEWLDQKMNGKKDKRRFRSVPEEDEGAVVVRGSTPVVEMGIKQLFQRTEKLQLLLQRFLACRPTGAAKKNRIVAVAMYPMVTESHKLYYDLNETMATFVDRFMELDVAECVKIHDIFALIAKQFDELDVVYTWCKTVGIGRSSEYPTIDKIARDKLDLMDSFIRDKALLASIKLSSLDRDPPDEPSPFREPGKEEVEEEYDVKAVPLPAPEGPKVEEKAEVQEDDTKEADFLGLEQKAVTAEEQENNLALALFDGNVTTEEPKWEAFPDDNLDWESALVLSASRLPANKPTLGGGLDVSLLDAMYQQQHPATTHSMNPNSASSIAVSTQGYLALPAPVGAGVDDPFAASLAVAPPAYVQMSEIERKRELVLQEQVMWQQYAMEGMHGQMGLAKLQMNHYPMMGRGGFYQQQQQQQLQQYHQYQQRY